jgi:hypothetical protein
MGCYYYCYYYYHYHYYTCLEKTVFKCILIIQMNNCQASCINFVGFILFNIQTTYQMNRPFPDE